MPAIAGGEDEEHQDSIRKQIKQPNLKVFIPCASINERACIEDSERHNHASPQDAIVAGHKPDPFLKTTFAYSEAHKP